MDNKYVPSYVKNKSNITSTPGASDASRALEAELAALTGGPNASVCTDKPAEKRAARGTVGMKREQRPESLMGRLLALLGIF